MGAAQVYCELRVGDVQRLQPLKLRSSFTVYKLQNLEAQDLHTRKTLTHKPCTRQLQHDTPNLLVVSGSGNDNVKLLCHLGLPQARWYSSSFYLLHILVPPFSTVSLYTPAALILFSCPPSLLRTTTQTQDLKSELQTATDSLSPYLKHCGP